MQLMNKIWLGAALVGLALNAGAANSEFSKAYSTCIAASEGITSNMLDCTANETKLQDARLNANYKAALKTIAPRRHESLKDAQRKWIKFRDAECLLQGNWSGGGTMDAINGSSCFLNMTKQRADDLESVAQQEE